MKFGMGQSVRRTEDLRLITGNGQYTDDLTLPEQAYAYLVRSPYAHAKLLSIDVEAAKDAPGVIAVLTFDDIEALGAGRLIGLAPLKGKGGKDAAAAEQPFLASGKVRWVGEAVAMVIAESLAEARDAAELVMVDYDALDAVGTLEAAEQGVGSTIWDSAPDNLCLDWEAGDEAGVAAAFAKAAHTASIEVVQNRIVCNAMETRAANGVYDAAENLYTLYSASQGVATLRDRVSMFLNHPKDKINVFTHDVGGGFGMKAFCYPEQLLVLLASKAVGRPVKWTGDRSEAFVSDAAGRDMRTKAEAALDAEGHILALRVTGSGNVGGYLSQYGTFIPTLGGSRVFGGVYRMPAVYTNIKCYFTNTAPVDAYRGAGRPEAAYFMERLMDRAAAAVGIDPVEIRRRNLLRTDELPNTNWAGVHFDSGEFHRNLEDALGKADHTGFPARRAEAASRGKLRGFGVAYYVEITAGGGNEPAVIRFTDNGGVEVSLGTQSNGQGHETSFAQVVAEKLGVPFESVTIKQGDSVRDIDGGGTGGSRSLHMSGGAMLSASDEVIRKGKLAASYVLEAAPVDIEFTVTENEGGRFEIAGTDRSITIGELAQEAKRRKIEGLEEGLDSTSDYHGPNSTFPNGAHLCEVEIDPDTGTTDIKSYTVVDDFGRVINPMIVGGQVHGGIVQGIGQALIEDCVYDPESGQLLTGSFMDYGMPRADDVPNFDLTFNEIPCPSNPLGVKGCGEAGTVGALAAVMNAVADAVSVRGIDHIDMPATPARVWEALQRAA